MADFTVLILCVLAFFIFENSLGMPSRKARLKVSENGKLQKPHTLLFMSVFVCHINYDVALGTSDSF